MVDERTAEHKGLVTLHVGSWGMKQTCRSIHELEFGWNGQAKHEEPTEKYNLFHLLQFTQLLYRSATWLLILSQSYFFMS